MYEVNSDTWSEETAVLVYKVTGEKGQNLEEMWFLCVICPKTREESPAGDGFG